MAAFDQGPAGAVEAGAGMNYDNAPFHEMLSEEQRRMLNAVCGDLARQLAWHGLKFDTDDFRHMLSGTVMGWRTVPGIDVGDGKTGWIMLGGSSLKLRKDECSQAITMGLAIGDDPSSQGLDHAPVRWSRTVLLGIGYSSEDIEDLNR